VRVEVLTAGVKVNVGVPVAVSVHVMVLVGDTQDDI